MHNISHFVFLLPIVLTVSILISSAGAVDTDGDGLLDLIDVPGFDPNATGSLIFESLGIQDLDGASLLTNLQTLGLAGNHITSIEKGAFDGLTNLQQLALFENQLTSIKSGTFDGLNNLQGLRLHGNHITSIESRAFDGLTNVETLRLGDNQFTELNLTGATFENLVTCGGVFGVFGFCAFSNTTTSLILDDAVLSLGAFNAIVRETPFITDVSLVALTFSDSLPASLDNLLGIATLDNVTVDQSLFDDYSDEFTAFGAMPGNTITVVPEPAGVFSLLIAILGLIAKSRIRLR